MMADSSESARGQFTLVQKWKRPKRWSRKATNSVIYLWDSQTLGFQPQFEEQVAVATRVLLRHRRTAVQIIEKLLQAGQTRMLELQERRRVVEGAPGLCG